MIARLTGAPTSGRPLCSGPGWSRMRWDTGHLPLRQAVHARGEAPGAEIVAVGRQVSGASWPARSVGTSRIVGRGSGAPAVNASAGSLCHSVAVSSRPLGAQVDGVAPRRGQRVRRQRRVGLVPVVVDADPVGVRRGAGQHRPRSPPLERHQRRRRTPRSAVRNRSQRWLSQPGAGDDAGLRRRRTGRPAARPHPAPRSLSAEDGARRHVEVQAALVVVVEDGDDPVAVAGHRQLRLVDPGARGVDDRGEELPSAPTPPGPPTRVWRRSRPASLVIGQVAVLDARRGLLSLVRRELGEVDREGGPPGQRGVEEVQRQVGADAAVGEPVALQLRARQRRGALLGGGVGVVAAPGPGRLAGAPGWPCGSSRRRAAAPRRSARGSSGSSARPTTTGRSAARGNGRSGCRLCAGAARPASPRRCPRPAAVARASIRRHDVLGEERRGSCVGVEPVAAAGPRHRERLAPARGWWSSAAA